MNAPASESALGIAHFLQQTDAVGVTLFIVLILMSMLSWTWIALKLVHMRQLRLRSRNFLSRFWREPSLQQAQQHLAELNPNNPYAHLTAQALQAQQHHGALLDTLGGEDDPTSANSSATLFDSGSLQDFVTRSLRQVLDEESTRLERGLTTLATIASTAPFVGLFGTVWGIYHALVAIGTSGSASLDQIAGPVGEALIMTAVGLAVAIPAVVAYNGFNRSNRVLSARLDAFAFDLLTLVCTGKTLPARSI